MKPNHILRNGWIASMALLVATTSFLSSCKKDESNKPAPALSVSTTSSSALPGGQVTTTVSVNAPEGGQKLAILVNGAADSTVPDVTLNGTASQDVPVAYTIPATATIGATYLFTFQATDNKGQVSPLATFLVTVSAAPDKPIVDVPAGNITTDQHWTADKIYRLNGFVRVGTDTHTGAGTAPVISATATLTIDAGTTIYGKTGAPGGTLIIQRGSKLIAIGTADKPILFTSEKAPGSRISGDWGGVVLCGKANINVKGTTQSSSTHTDGIEELEGAYGAFYGGGANSDDADNTGTIQYVRIEYAGFPIQPNQEINGLTFGGVGSGTTVDHVQVSFSNDDSFEWFGGTINCNNLIAFKGLDDDFDTDQGFSGHVQFGLGIRDPNIADQSGSNGFECDNDAGGSSNQPFTNATFSNCTMIGGKAAYNTPVNVQFQNGAQIRRNAKQDVINTFITAYPNGAYFDNQAAGVITNITNGELVFRKDIIAGVENWGGNGFGSIATADEIAGITGLNFNVPQTAGSSTLGNFNHVAPPRGFVIALGVGAFTSGAFALTTPGQINGVNAIPWFKTANTLYSKWNDTAIKLDPSIFAPTTTPNLLPGAGSVLLTGADFTGYSGFTNVAYIGAFGTTDWTTGGWVDWDPQFTEHGK